MRNGGQQQVSTGPRGPIADDTGKFVARVLGSTEQVWSEVLPQQANVRYTKPQLVLFSGATRSSCGAAQAAMGPFYCPLDRKVYLDTAFFNEMQRRLGGGGDFAYAYVIAHEVGHHVQNLLGILPKVQEAQQRLPKREANALSVRVELMADCLAGVWANHSKDAIHLDQNDIREAMTTASAIGDDALQKQAQGYAVPDSFTHGSSAQRQQWFNVGLQSGNVKTCNTFQSRQ
jgi:predicted metalloprotease